MTRTSRSRIAKETVTICEAGFYEGAYGSRIEIGAAIRRAAANTKVYSPATVRSISNRTKVAMARLQVTPETTIAALQRLNREGGAHLGCLNFASAKNPGGGFLNGSQAQEESIARSSALYPCLLAGREYYERNRAAQTALYLDLAIWSPAVPFFRDDSGALLSELLHASVITAPAPNAGAVILNEPERAAEIEPTLRRRAAFVLAIAAEEDVRRLVLGAWGCGVFRNDPAMVARVFGELLGSGGEFVSAFDEVVFAIYERSPDQPMVRLFKEGLM